jgi:hypothetical protein
MKQVGSSGVNCGIKKDAMKKSNFLQPKVMQCGEADVRSLVRVRLANNRAADQEEKG